jgi:hypothetical protein
MCYEETGIISREDSPFKFFRSQRLIRASYNDEYHSSVLEMTPVAHRHEQGTSCVPPGIVPDFMLPDIPADTGMSGICDKG